MNTTLILLLSILAAAVLVVALTIGIHRRRSRTHERWERPEPPGATGPTVVWGTEDRAHTALTTHTAETSDELMLGRHRAAPPVARPARLLGSALPAPPGPAAPTQIRTEHPPISGPTSTRAAPATLQVSDSHADFAPRSVELPEARRHVTIGGLGADVELPAMTDLAGEVTLTRNGDRWLVSCDRADVAYLNGLPLRSIPFPVLARSEITIGRWQLRIGYGRREPAFHGTEIPAVAVTFTPGPPPAVLPLAEALISAAFDPWEPQPGPAALARALSALTKLGVAAPKHFAVVGFRADRGLEVAGSSDVEMLMSDQDQWQQLPEGGAHLKRVVVPPGTRTVSAIHLGKAQEPSSESRTTTVPTTARSTDGATLLLPVMTPR